MGFPIVFSTDENYIAPTYVAVHSLLRHIDPKTDIEIFILYSGVKEEQKQYFYELSNKIHFIEVNMQNSNLNKDIPYISVATYYRFLIPELLSNYDRCLYLDSDLIIKEDITPLVNMPMRKNLILGARNYFSKEEDYFFYLKRCKECSIENLSHYVNAGVLLLNLDGFRKDNLYRIMIEDATHNFYPYNDQDVLNKYCNGKISLLSIKYNFMAPYLKNIKATSKAINEDVAVMAKAPVIVHYSTAKKPWKYRGYLMADLWYEELDSIPQKVRKELINVFVKKHRDTRRLKEKVLDELKYLHRKYVLKSFIKTPQTKFRL